MNAIAVVPARGGSKRIPRKNVRPFLGTPALSYPVRAALASGVFGEVIVSTDDSEIAAVAQRFGARVLRRPSHLSGDEAPVAAACEHALREVLAEGAECELVCMVYATAVLVSAEDLRRTHARMAEARFERLVSVCELPVHPFKSLRLQGEWVEPAFPEEFRARTQDMPHLVAHNGAFAWARTSAFLQEPRFVGPNTGAFEMPWWRSVDIDTPEDWERAERLAQLMVPSRVSARGA